MIIEKLCNSGAYVISELRRGYLETRTFYGYTFCEAVEEYRGEFPGKFPAEYFRRYDQDLQSLMNEESNE